MTKLVKNKPGDFCWMELITPNLSTSKQFYAKLFGWQTHSHLMPNGGEYTMLNINGDDIVSAFELTDQMREEGASPDWSSYIYTDDVDATAKEAIKLGGYILHGPFDIMHYGRMAVIQDPSGAIFNLWKPYSIAEKQPTKKTHGMFSWNELLTDDFDRSVLFYSALLGWDILEQEFPGDFKYSIMMNGDEPVAGIMDKTPACKSLPTNWSVYFTTKNLDKTVHDATELGGKTCCEPVDIENFGRITMLKDPEKVNFSIVEYA